MIGFIAPAVVVAVTAASSGDADIETSRNTLGNSLVEVLGVFVGHC